MTFAAAMETGVVGVESLEFEQAKEVVPQHLVAKAEEGVDGVTGGTATTFAKLEVAVGQTLAEGGEVLGGAGSFDSHEGIDLMGFGDFFDELGELLDDDIELGVGVTTALAQQEGATVFEFAADDVLGDDEAVNLAELLLVAGELAVAPLDGKDATVAVAEAGEVGDGDVSL